MSNNPDTYISLAPDPDTAALRYQRLREGEEARTIVDSLSDRQMSGLIAIIGTSNFLFHLICRHPDWMTVIGAGFSLDRDELDGISSFEALRRFKYRSLLKLTWMDISLEYNYSEVLYGLSLLSESILQHAFRLVLDDEDYSRIDEWLAVFALGKLGASELNYSSDIDLVFVSANAEELGVDLNEMQALVNRSIRDVSGALETRTEDGFLYRVDLKLRPWGSSGPLCMGLDATEQYYEASSETWERFAWLRSRVVAGSRTLGQELRKRMKPFVFMRSLSTEDLDRFLQIKQDMARARKRRGRWNVKVGEGGIRDIEFFTQILQLVNAAEYDQLQGTSTIKILSGLCEIGVLQDAERDEVLNSYLFLRRLENRLQMVDEKQTHELPDAAPERLKIARSLRVEGESDGEILDNFENALFLNQSVAKIYFDRVLPQRGD